MAREEDLKKVELNVSVNCCDGCKKKVLKALSIKGVLKIEIHPSLPRVTVVGNVSEEVLVKRLAKWGKVAEVVASPPPAAEARKVPPQQKQPPPEQEQQQQQQQQQGSGDTKKSETKSKEGDCARKVSCESEQKKPSLSECGGKAEKIENRQQNSSSNECATNAKSPTTNVASAPIATVSAMIAPPLRHVNCFVSPAGVAHETMLLQQNNPYPYQYPYLYPCLPNGQTGFASPYIAPPAYWVTPSTIQVPMTQSYNARECCGAPPPRLTEYFNDDNTAGCFVM